MATNQKSTNPAGDIPNDILIVDDEMPNLKLLSELLGREGCQVRPANNPLMAIDSALAQPPKLILLDVRMPQMDGFEVCKRLKQDERNILTIEDPTEYEIEGVNQGQVNLKAGVTFASGLWRCFGLTPMLLWSVRYVTERRHKWLSKQLLLVV